MVVIETFAGDSATFHCTTNRAAGIGIMPAVAEFAGAQIIPEFDETAGNEFRRKMPQAEFTYPRGINQMSAMAEMV